uniref:Glia maturation factor n=1 Tax=Periophthalmus magnuspinnatus TaxID=409849 RepID=A0A3B3ZDN5_9GOBI
MCFVSPQSESLVVCQVDQDLVKKLNDFRFRKETTNAAIIMKIDKDKQQVVLEEEYEDISPEDLKDELPERQPRYPLYLNILLLLPLQPPLLLLLYKYEHEDKRVSYPLCFIFSSPVGCKPEQQMMYAGSKNELVRAGKLTKVFEIRNTEDLTEEWLRSKLGFFR